MGTGLWVRKVRQVLNHPPDEYLEITLIIRYIVRTGMSLPGTPLNLPERVEVSPAGLPVLAIVRLELLEVTEHTCTTEGKLSYWISQALEIRQAPHPHIALGPSLGTAACS